MTCGTCAKCSHCQKRHGPIDPMANHVCLHMGALIVDQDKPNCSGMYYDERTDSLEQVAREMYAVLSALCRNCNEDVCCNLADDGWPESACTFEFRDRLNAMGIDV